MGWQGTYKIWQNKAFGEIYTNFTNSKKFMLDNTPVFVSNKLIAGNITLYLYYPSDDKIINEVISLASNLNVARIKIYTTTEFSELENNFNELSKTFVLDLTLSEETLWNNIKGTARNRIRKGMNNGVEVKIADDEKELIEWWQVYTQASRSREYSSINLPLVKSLFHERDLAKLFIASVNKKIVSGFFFLTDDYPLYWIGAYDRHYKTYSPNNLNMWNAILWFKNKGYKLLDFGGARLNPMSGPTKFKKKFGGTIMTNYIYQIVISNIKNNIMEIYLEARKAFLEKSFRLFNK